MRRDGVLTPEDVPVSLLEIWRLSVLEVGKAAWKAPEEPGNECGAERGEGLESEQEPCSVDLGGPGEGVLHGKMS